MKFTPVINQEAENELNEIAFYLDRQKSGLGNLLIAEYLKTLNYLEEFAEAVPMTHPGFRHIQIGRFQILMIYSIHEDSVRIRKIIHAARDQNSRYRY